MICALIFCKPVSLLTIFDCRTVSIGAHSQLAHIHLDRHMSEFMECNLNELVKHNLHALRETLSTEQDLTMKNVSIGIVGKDLEFMIYNDDNDVSPFLEGLGERPQRKAHVPRQHSQGVQPPETARQNQQISTTPPHQETVFDAPSAMSVEKDIMFTFTEKTVHDLRFGSREAISNSYKGHNRDSSQVQRALVGMRAKPVEESFNPVPQQGESVCVCRLTQKVFNASQLLESSLGELELIHGKVAGGKWDIAELSRAEIGVLRTSTAAEGACRGHTAVPLNGRVAPLSNRGPSKVGELGACLLRHQAFQKPLLSRRLLKGLVHQRTGTQLHREKRKREQQGLADRLSLTRRDYHRCGHSPDCGTPAWSPCHLEGENSLFRNSSAPPPRQALELPCDPAATPVKILLPHLRPLDPGTSTSKGASLRSSK
ncbi:hypothetical protein QTO34_003782 [Cnephaeus nilssonii]|uniref:Uncharacterized protein n=1 Tax=Cnephaeus nilssonii TaxID=3371016 RepID=A0AA40HSD5_CNENI|nr:hypothetical protein QTO34_003782 [Eptesicus nilssonii]